MGYEKKDLEEEYFKKLKRLATEVDTDGRQSAEDGEWIEDFKERESWEMGGI